MAVIYSDPMTPKDQRNTQRKHMEMFLTLLANLNPPKDIAVYIGHDGKKEVTIHDPDFLPRGNVFCETIDDDISGNNYRYTVKFMDITVTLYTKGRVLTDEVVRD